MRKTIIAAQVALICALAALIARRGADTLDIAAITTLILSSALNIFEEVHDAK